MFNFFFAPSLVLGPGEEGMFEGQDAESGRRGYFPARCVREVGSLGANAGQTFLEAASGYDPSLTMPKHQNIVSGTMSLRHRSRSAATLYAEELLAVPRTVVIQRTPAGFGFVLKGPRAAQMGQADIDFVGNSLMPATQYLAVVESGSVADRAGLKPKDYVLEIDGVNVVSATHERCVELIRSSSDMLQLKVVTVPNQVGPSPQKSNFEQTNTERPPRPWMQKPSLTNNGVMTLSRNHQMRQMAPAEQLEMALRSQLTLPRQPRQQNNRIVGRSLSMSTNEKQLKIAELQQQQQQQLQQQEGESDYETIDDSGNGTSIDVTSVSQQQQQQLQQQPNVNNQEHEEATYSSQLEQMDSGNSSCSNTNNEEVTSGGTLYANAGQLRRLYGVCNEDGNGQNQEVANTRHFDSHDDSNYDVLTDESKQNTQNQVSLNF